MLRGKARAATVVCHTKFESKKSMISGKDHSVKLSQREVEGSGAGEIEFEAQDTGQQPTSSTWRDDWYTTRLLQCKSRLKLMQRAVDLESVIDDHLCRCLLGKEADLTRF